jgi:hypothetical protein
MRGVTSVGGEVNDFKNVKSWEEMRQSLFRREKGGGLILDTVGFGGLVVWWFGGCRVEE